MRIVIWTLACACATPAVRFAARPPIVRDGDLDPMAHPCRPDPAKPGHEICRPREWVSSLAWDGADNLFFRPISGFFAVDPPDRAVDVNSLDEVPDSSWFTDRGALTPDRVVGGPCEGGPTLDVDAPDGSWTIDQGKMNGSSPGFRVTYRGAHFLLKADNPGEGERPTAAEPIVSRLYWAIGFNAPCEAIVLFRPSLLKLEKGLTYVDNLDRRHALDDKALKRMLKTSTHDGLVRMSTSRWLPGRVLGPWRYEGTRDDDPADAIAHQDRRELRGARLMAAWVNHFDSREQNTLATWAAAGADPDSSPGVVLHWFIDFSDCFGSPWHQDAMTRRLGYSYYLDFGVVLTDWLTFGVIRRPWDTVARSPEGPIFNYYVPSPFDPATWKPGYPNPAFDRMREDDGAWMARRIARITPEMVAAAVATGKLDDPRHTAYLEDTLGQRREAILRRYLVKLSPLADVSLDGSELCAIDLARASGVWDDAQFHYLARLGPDTLPVRLAPAGRVCVTLPPRVLAGGYHIVRIANGLAKSPLRVHISDGGIVGLER